MNRTVLLSTTALLFGATAAFAHQDVTSIKTANGLVLSMTTRAQAPQHLQTPHNLVAFDAGNIATKDVKGEYTPWEAYIVCGSAAAGTGCSKVSFAFNFTSGATLALAKLGGYQLGIDVAPSAASFCGTGAAATLNVSLYTNVGGLPGTPIAGSAATLTATTTWGTYSAPVQKLLKKAVQLGISTEYWMVASPGSGNTCVAWDVQDLDYVDSTTAAVSGAAPTTWSATSFTGDFAPAFGVVR
jgi:hypothetical protein